MPGAKATPQMDGLMSAADKAALDSVSLPVTVSGNSVTFAAAAAGRPVDTVVHIEPVQSGSGDPSPSNVRPITGWTGAKVTRTGKNLLNWGEAVIGSINSATGAEMAATSRVRSGYIPALPGLTYIMSCETGQDIIPYFVVFYNENRERISDTSTSSVFTVPNSARWMRLVFRKSNSSDAFTAEELSGFHVQLEIGDTATSFQAFGSAYTISFGSAGTVYGGTLDVARGLLTVTHGLIASYNEETLPGAWISDRDVYAAGTNPTTGAQVVYELSAPAVYQLTPQQMTALLGTNTVWADCGSVDVTHWPGTGTPMAPRDAAGPTAAQFWAAYDELKNAIIANGGNV